MSNPRVFMDITHGGTALGRVMFELYHSSVPRTSENFRALCTGELGQSPKSRVPRHYKGSIIHRIIDGFMIQGGDFTKRNGTGGESIYYDTSTGSTTFPDEDLSQDIDREGLLVMANRGPNTNGSQFFITLAPSPHLKGKHVVFGRVVGAKGLEVIQQIAKVAVDDKDKPFSPVEVAHCGELVRKSPVVNAAPARDRSASVSDSSGKHIRRQRSASYSRSDEESDSASDAARLRKKRRKEEKRLQKEEKRARRKAKRVDREDRRLVSPSMPRKTEEELREEERRAEAEKALQEEEERQRIERRRRDLERLRRDDDDDAPVVYKGRGAMRYRDNPGGMRAY